VRQTHWDTLKRMDRKSDNVLRETAGSTELVCGHFAQGQPVAIYPSKRKLYLCPKGCGLQKSKR
jgi:hypothetical protein